MRSHKGWQNIGCWKNPELKKIFRAENIVNASGKTFLPGFADSSTHLVFVGSMEDESQIRIEGVSYGDFKGCEILKTVMEPEKPASWLAF